MDIISFNVDKKILYVSEKYKPIHNCPFPSYPMLHVHVKLPAVLIQVAVVSQL